MNQDDKTMLALAALTYRGFGHHSEAAIEKALRPWLPKVEAQGLGSWDLIWGPATFRVPTSLFDDAMMYVAQERGKQRYAIVIRGTNPLSFFDWFFGDFWVRLQIDWTPAGSVPAKMSASTALGLAIGQHLAAEVPASTSGFLAPFGNQLADALQDLVQHLAELMPERLLKDPASNDPDLFTDAMLMARINELTGTAGSALRSSVLDRLRDRFEAVKKPLQEAIERRVFDLIVNHVNGTERRGETLLEFLNRTVKPGSVVAVTGHSKGGALAIGTALSLQESWAPAHQAEIHCFSFAGPTAGDKGFADRYNTALKDRTRSIVNPLDLVPHAWVPDKLKLLPDAYPALAIPLRALIQSSQNSGYTHVGGEIISTKRQPGGHNLVQEIIHQHLDAYLIDAAFTGPDWNARSIFLGD